MAYFPWHAPGISCRFCTGSLSWFKFIITSNLSLLYVMAHDSHAITCSVPGISRAKHSWPDSPMKCLLCPITRPWLGSIMFVINHWSITQSARLNFTCLQRSYMLHIHYHMYVVQRLSGQISRPCSKSREVSPLHLVCWGRLACHSTVFQLYNTRKHTRYFVFTTWLNTEILSFG